MSATSWWRTMVGSSALCRRATWSAHTPRATQTERRGVGTSETGGCNMRVTELMHTPAVTCPPRTPTAAVARLMGDRNVGSVVVADDVGYLAGIVTDCDVAVRGVGEGRSGD